MGRVGQSALYEQDGEVYLLVDEAAYEPNWMGLAATWVCETAEQLEGEMGLPGGSLRATLGPLQPARRARRGPVVPQGAGVGAPARAPDRRLRPAYRPGAVRAVHPGWAGDHGRRRGAQRRGDAIPGLFAAGRTTAGVCAFGYASGLSIGDSTMFGRFAGASSGRVLGLRRPPLRARRGVLGHPVHHDVVGLVDGTAVERRLRVVLDHQLGGVGRLCGRRATRPGGAPCRCRSTHPPR